ncbi:MAG: hypothetical protein OQK76_12760 [Gammaproteobacteria bacterium]|nr:hypothetical protein [Gammaproteobacteria bacterium]
MKQQLALFTILFIAMGCNNSPNAQQNSSQPKDQNESTVSTITEGASEKMRITDDILAIDQKIADLEEQEKLRISKEIKLIQEKIANLEKQETEIDSALTQLETQIAIVATKTRGSDDHLATKETVVNTDVAENSEAITETAKPQQPVAANQNSVFGWGDWGNGIKPAAGPAPVAVKVAAVNVPAINFRPNEHSAFSRSVVDNTPAGPVVDDTPAGPVVDRTPPPPPVASATPGTTDPRSRRR